MEQENRGRANRFIKDLVTPAWQPSRDRVLWATRIVLVFTVLLAVLTLIGWPFGISLWDWLKLLIIPAVLAVGGYLFNRSENRATQAAAERRAQDEALQTYLDQISQLLLERDLRASNFDDEVRTVARAQTIAVLGRLGPHHKRSLYSFLYEHDLCTYKTERPPVSKGVVLDLESGKAAAPTVELYEADLREAHLSGMTLYNVSLDFANLTSANLRRARFAVLSREFTDEELESPVPLPLGTAMLTRDWDRWAQLVLATGAPTDIPWKKLDESWEPAKVASLFYATLSNADLNNAVLAGVDLFSADLTGANLTGTLLQGARLRDAVLTEANLKEAILRRADLKGADLKGADLRGADLRGADLTAAKLTKEQLQVAESLEGATMPNGQILQGAAVPDGPTFTFEEWLKSQDRGEAGENE